MLLQAKAGESHSAQINIHMKINQLLKYIPPLRSVQLNINTINNKNSALMCVLKCLVRFQAVGEMTANTLSPLYAPRPPSSVGVHEVKYISPPARGQHDST